MASRKDTLNPEEIPDSELRYRIVADNTFDFEFWINPEGRFLYVSPSCRRIYGRGPDEFLANPELREVVIHPDDRIVFELHKTEEEKRHPGKVDFRIVRPDGTQTWIGHLCQPVFDKVGNYLGVRGSNRDITDRKNAEDALQEANANLESKVQERTAELVRQSAQLRELAAELTLSEQRERRRIARVLHDHLQQVLVAAKFRLAIVGRNSEATVKQAVQEVEELLDEAIVASRSLTSELNPPILHQAGLTAGLEWLAGWTAKKYGLIVNLSIEDGLASPSEDAKVLLFESVRELLFNAVKHAHVDSVAVDAHQIGGRDIGITVSDDGPGFDPARLKEAGGSGGGFGLFSIRERLQLIGGKMEIESAPGKGSRIMLKAPLDKPHA